ncbi:hypothetical protein GCM10010234_04110 [Streptomyces hawaiiensis]
MAAPLSAVLTVPSLQPPVPVRLSGRPLRSAGYRPECDVKEPRRRIGARLCPGCVTNTPPLSHMSRVRGSSVTPGAQALPGITGRR